MGSVCLRCNILGYEERIMEDLKQPEVNTGQGDILDESYKPDYWDFSVTPPCFITHCKGCDVEVRLVKDSLEGKRAYCGDCSKLL